MSQYKTAIFLLCMGEDDLYRSMTLTVIDQLTKHPIFPIVVLTDEFNKNNDGYKNTKWVIPQENILQKQNSILNNSNKFNWECCGNKILIFDIAEELGYENIIYLDSDIYIYDVSHIMEINKKVNSFPDKIYMIPDSLYVPHETLNPNISTWYNGGFFIANIKNKPNKEKYLELLDKGYTDQDAFSELWQDKLCAIPSAGFNHLFTNHIIMHLQNTPHLIYTDASDDVMDKYIDLLRKHYKNYNSKIAIITPIYKDYDNYKRQLFDLSLQTSSNFIIILVEDHTKGLYRDLLKEFPTLNIRMLQNMSEFNGPSATRQLGLDYVIDNKLADWVMFLDSDDLFASNYALEHAQYIISKNDISLYKSGALVRGEYNTLSDSYTEIDLKGNLYNIDVIKEKNIRFSNTYHWEDILFNITYQYNIPKDKIYSAKLPMVNYMWNQKSVTNIGKYDNKHTCVYIHGALWRTLVWLELNKYNKKDFSTNGIFSYILRQYNVLFCDNKVEEEDKTKILGLYDWLLGYIHKVDNTVDTHNSLSKINTNYEYTEQEINEIYASLKTITQDSYNGRITLELKHHDRDALKKYII